MRHYKGIEQPAGFRNNSKIRRAKKDAARLHAAFVMAAYIAKRKAERKRAQ